MTPRLAAPEIARPPIVFVSPFAVDPGDVVVDQFGPSFANDGGSLSERRVLGEAISIRLAEMLVRGLNENGISARRVARGATPPPDGLLISGTFVTVDEGDRATRMTIGFGAGREELRALVRVFQQTEIGLRRVQEALAQAHGNSMPGMAVPVAGGAAAGNVVVSATVSGATNVIGEARSGLDSAADRLAEQLVKRCVAYYDRKGWR